MQYQKKYVQKTVMADDPESFDRQINAIYEKAARERYEPKVHFFEGLGLCASITYWETIEIAENAQDRLQLEGIMHTCADCEHFRPSYDGRVKWVKCAEGGCMAGRTSPACLYHYEELEERRTKESVQEPDRGAGEIRHQAQAAR